MDRFLMALKPYVRISFASCASVNSSYARAVRFDLHVRELSRCWHCHWACSWLLAGGSRSKAET